MMTWKRPETEQFHSDIVLAGLGLSIVKLKSPKFSVASCRPYLSYSYLYKLCGRPTCLSYVTVNTRLSPRHDEAKPAV